MGDGGISSDGDRVVAAGGGRPSTPTRPESNLPPVGYMLDEQQHPVTGARIGRYLIRGRLGHGGMGVVLEAYDQTLDRPVAIKLLQRELGEHHAQRLIREAQALARLSHPNVVAVYEVGLYQGRTFIAMERLSGQTLWDWQQTPRSWTEIVDVYIQAGRGLAAAHAEGLVHRDFKPNNCIVDGKGRVWVLDFGLAGDAETLKRAAQARKGVKGDRPVVELDLDKSNSALARPLTSDGTVLGTLPYMAPEQLGDGPIDAKSDQYSYCISLFEALYGHRPQQGTELDVARAVGRSLPSRSAARGTPRAVQRIIERGLSPDQGDRWPSMDELLRRLEHQRRARWRRWGAVVLVTANLGVIGLVSANRQLDRTPPCQGSSRRLDGIWDEARREQIHAALLDTGVAYASDMWAAVQGRLDHYSAAWVTMHTDACEATRVHGEQSEAVLDLRMRCLEQRRVALEQAVGLLARADAQVVEQAARVIADLPVLSRCADVEALSAEFPPPDDPAVAMRLGPLRAQAHKAWALRKSGKYAESLAVLEPVLSEAEELGYPALLAEVLRERGDLHHSAGRYGDAEQDLRRAFSLALRSGHQDVAAQASTELTFVSGAMLGNAELGRWMGESAEALAQRRDPNGVMEARALVRIGQLLGKLGDDEAAEHRLVRALKLLDRVEETDPLEVVYALDGLRGVLKRQGRYDEAERRAREAVTIVERELGVRHPLVAFELAHLATVLVPQGKQGEAERKLRRALRVAQVALPADHPTTALVRSNLGATLLYQGKTEEAELELTTALWIWQSVYEPEHEHVAGARSNLGVIHRSLGRNAQAEEHYRRALASYLTAYGHDQDHPAIAMVRLNLGKAVQAQGRYDEAGELYQLARRSFERKYGPAHPRVASALESLGALYFEQGRYDESLASHEKARSILMVAFSADEPRPELARSAWALGRTLHRVGRLDDARDRLVEALNIHREIETRPKAQARTEFALSRVLWDLGDEREATRIARAAQERLSAPGAGVNSLHDEIEAWMAEHRSGDERTP
ncbi:MAG: serine/threonine-protein kinase [Myxococcota bacterium]